MFSLARNLLKMDAYSDDFQRVFRAKNPVIASRSDQNR